MKPMTAGDEGTVVVEEPSPVDAACAQVMAAVEDRRENGGTIEAVRAAVIGLFSRAFDQLEQDED